MAGMISVSELGVTYKVNNMNKLFRSIKHRPWLWVAVLIAIISFAAAVQAALPVISLNSPVSFPVDI